MGDSEALFSLSFPLSSHQPFLEFPFLFLFIYPYNLIMDGFMKKSYDCYDDGTKRLETRDFLLRIAPLYFPGSIYSIIAPLCERRRTVGNGSG